MRDPPQGAEDVSGTHFCGQSCDSSSPYAMITRSKFIGLWGPTCQEWGASTHRLV